MDYGANDHLPIYSLDYYIYNSDRCILLHYVSFKIKIEDFKGNDTVL